jgi:16S rRNA (cytosine967-C5)-methyltransferase
VEGAQQQAALAVRRVLEGGTLGAALAAAAVGEDAAGGRRHSLVQELAYGTLRHWGRLDALTRRVATKPLTDPLLACLVAVAIYQLDHTRAPPFAIVNHAVDNAGTLVRPGAKSLVNALLRRYLREREALHESVCADPVARWSYPRWWIDRVRRDHPDDWQAILEAGNERPPLTLRVNVRVGSREALVARFAHAGVAATAVGAAGIVVLPPRPVLELPGFAEARSPCRMPARSLPLRCFVPRTACARSTPAPRRAGRRRIWPSSQTWRSWHSTRTAHASRASMRTLRACRMAPPPSTCAKATPRIRRAGGMAQRST